MKKHGVMSYKDQLRASEQRNRDAVAYLVHLQKVCKQVLLVSGDEFKQMDLIITPEGERLKPIFAKICCIVADVCKDVEDIKLTPELMAAMVKQGGKAIQFPSGEPEDNPEASTSDSDAEGSEENAEERDKLEDNPDK